MTLNTTKAANIARDASDDALQSAQSAVETTRGYANEALDKAGEKVRDLRNNVDPLVEQITAKVQQLASRGIEYATDAKSRAQQQIIRYGDATGRYVAEQPVKSVLIAAATGAAIAAAILIATRSSNTNRNRY